MITALDIREKRTRGIMKLARRFRRNKIRVEHLYSDKAVVKCVTYECSNGKVNWNAIDRFVKSQRNHILCAEELSLPKGSGYRRFESFELQKRLCMNAALWLLENSGEENVPVGIIDPDTECIGLSKYLFDFTDSVTAFVGNVGLYLNEAEELLEEKGAALRVSKNPDALKDCRVIIAPAGIDDTCRFPGDAIVFTSKKPKSPVGCVVIYRFFFDLDEKYRSIMPKFLPAMYFADAMYTLAGAYELAHRSFKYCTDGKNIHTRKSLLSFFKALY